MRLFYKLILASAAFGCLAAGCKTEIDGYSVDKDSVVLEAFGPNPVLRGAELKFVGQNLDKISSVILPVGIEISSSEFKEAGSNSFKVLVPIECEPGEVSLVYPEGRITPKSRLSYTERYEIHRVYPKEEGLVELEAGDSLVVEGEYINNIVKFVFSNGAVAEGELIGTQTRRKVCFAVPAGALSGRIYAEDSNGNQIYSQEEVKIKQPVISKISPLKTRPGDEVTITGLLLDQVVSLSFSGSASVIEKAAFLSASKTSIKARVPSDVHDGPVTIVSMAQQQIVSEENIEVKTPSNISLSADKYKAGSALTINGEDLDLVTELKFHENVASEFSFSGGKIVTSIPAEAKDGKLSLGTAAGKTVLSPSVTLVKPVIYGLSATEVVAGKPFGILGTDLDLVTEVTLNGTACQFQLVGDILGVATAANSTSGKVAVKTANGTVVEAPSELTITYDVLVLVSNLTSEVGAGSPANMNGSNFNMIESIYFGDVKVTEYSLRTDTEMTFTVPADVPAATYNIKFVLTTGEEEICIHPIKVLGAVQTDVIWEGNHDLGNWNNTLKLASQFAGIPHGCSLHIDYEAQNGAQLKFADIAHGWGNMPGINGGNLVQLDASQTHLTYELPDATVDILKSGGTALQGKLATIKKVYITYPKPSVPSEIMINDFETRGEHSGSWDKSWDGNTDFVTEGGNSYLKVTGEATGWVINCNHQSKGALGPIVNNIGDYDLLIDVFVPSGWSEPGNILYKIVFGNNWYDYGYNMFKDAEGNGTWQTLRIKLSSLTFPAVVDMSTGTNGLYIAEAGLPIGMGLDNLRLGLKK